MFGGFRNAQRSALKIGDQMTPYTLDIEDFRKVYPGLSEEVISDEGLENLWAVVSVQLGDGEGNFPYSPKTIKPILYAALCHLATLQTSDSNQPGRVASASQGSTSVSFENLQVKSETGQWWNQTKCGALFWVLTQRYRTGCKLYRGSNYHPWG